MTRRSVRASVLLSVAVLTLPMLFAGSAAPAAATGGYDRISGSGSTWSANAVTQWVANVRPRGLIIDFNPNGSSGGRQDFRSSVVDFAVSEIPYGRRDANGSDDPPPQRGFGYMPIVAGGTSFMYNLSVGGQQISNLRLSGENVAKIFTGQITRWNDPAVAADNPGLDLPGIPVVPVVRSDGSGTTAQFTLWMKTQYPQIWDAYCQKAGLTTPCESTSIYPTIGGSTFVGASGSDGVQNAVRQATGAGAINYVEYSYAINARFPVVKVLNKAGFYVAPTASNVAVALTGAQIETQNTDPRVYLTQRLDGVYNNADPRAYPLSSYSYMILPTDQSAPWTSSRGATVAAFGYYFLCEGQRQADPLGYSPLPINLVQAGFDQLKRIPGARVQDIDIRNCGNPTFDGNDTSKNVLAETAPQPQPCDQQGPYQCPTRTGGAQNDTPVKASAVPPASGGVSNGGGNGSDAGSGGGGSGGGGGESSGGGGSPVQGPAGSGSVADGASDGSGVDGASAGGVIDPVTGELIGVDDGTGFADGTAGGGSGGPSFVAGQAVSLDANSGWQLKYTVMILVVLSLLAATVGPALLARRLGRTG